MKALPIFLLGFTAAVSSAPTHAADPASATTTLAPVSVHASDTAVTETPGVQVRVTRARLQQQNTTN